MKKNYYLYNSDKEIIKLKENLLANDNNSVHSFSSYCFKKRNSEIEKIFEENIRNTLNFEFRWENFLSNSKNTTIKKRKKILQKYANNKRDIIKVNISKKKLVVKKEKEIETDKYFHIENFDFSKLNEDFSIVYRNIEDEELEEVNSVLIETKLNKSKIPEMISQIKEDKKIYEKMTNDKILYMGIVGCSGKNKNIDIDYEKELDGIKCVILEMDNSTFCGRNMKYPLDWKLIRQVKKNTDDIAEIKTTVAELKSSVAKLKSFVAKLETFVAKLKSSVTKLETSMAGMQNDIKEIKDLLISHFSNRNMKMIGKKRKRSRRQNN